MTDEGCESSFESSRTIAWGSVKLCVDAADDVIGVVVDDSEEEEAST
jgi:hypothetical protein